MKCFSCATQIPSEALAPNFCIACGRPLTQPCPYEMAAHQPGDPPTYRLPLCDERGRATTSCPSCKGLFKACDTCLRLHKLERTACMTPGCTGKLREPIAAYPSPTGAFDGTQTANWPFPWDTLPKHTATPNLEEFQAMAFRYGLLVAVSTRNLLCYAWEGQQWQQQGVKSLVNSGDLIARSLHLEQGRAFVLGQDRALVFTLVGGISEAIEPQMGAFVHQAVGPRWWLRVGNGGRLLLTDCETWQTVEKSLPPEAGEVIDIASDTRIFLATAKGHVYSVDTHTGEPTRLLQHKARWARIAVQSERLALLGYDAQDATGGMILLVTSADGKTAFGERKLSSGVVPDFTWVGDSLYVARQFGDDNMAGQGKSALETYNTRQLTVNPAVANLSGGATTPPGMLTLVNPRREPRLLLRSVDNAAQQWALVNPVSGKQDVLRPILDHNRGTGNGDVDGWPDDAPLVCVADTRLLIAPRESGKTTLLTYEVQENS